jgi:hypothetical protein
VAGPAARMLSPSPSAACSAICGHTTLIADRAGLCGTGDRPLGGLWGHNSATGRNRPYVHITMHSMFVRYRPIVLMVRHAGPRRARPCPSPASRAVWSEATEHR